MVVPQSGLLTCSRCVHHLRDLREGVRGSEALFCCIWWPQYTCTCWFSSHWFLLFSSPFSPSLFLSHNLYSGNGPNYKTKPGFAICLLCFHFPHGFQHPRRQDALCFLEGSFIIWVQRPAEFRCKGRVALHPMRQWCTVSINSWIMLNKYMHLDINRQGSS